MAGGTVTSTKEIWCPIEVVRAQFNDLKHHIVSSVHRNLELTLHADDERGCDLTQGCRTLGLLRRDKLRLDRKADGSQHGKLRGRLAHVEVIEVGLLGPLPVIDQLPRREHGHAAGGVPIPAALDRRV